MATTIETTEIETTPHVERVPPVGPGSGSWTLAGWAVRDSPYIAMLILALIGVMFQMTVLYWMILTPIFGAVSIVAGWRRFRTAEGYGQTVLSLVLSWFGVVIAILLFYATEIRTTMEAREQSLGIMTLLALGTFTAGVQARVWRFCIVAVLLFLAVLAMSWMGASPFIVIAGVVIVVGAATLAWWLDRRAYRALQRSTVL